MRPFDGRRVLLVVSGGIAAYKSAILTRRLVEAGAVVDAILTAGARHFIGATTFEGITGRPVHEDTWSRPMAHLDLGRNADVAVVAPATADMLARLAVGRADDLATATLLAAPCPVILAPAMNTRMWEHPATRRNMSFLEEHGGVVVGPDDGPLSEGEVGRGRMSEPEAIMARIGRALEPESALTGRKVVVTAGPTRAPIDPVRFVCNRSSGRMGYALAAAAWRRGCDVVLVSGPATVPHPSGPRVLEVETAAEMLDALKTELSGAHILLKAAAVGDFEAAEVAPTKIKKGDRETLTLALRSGPDLLAETRRMRASAGIFTLGFALETGDGIEEGKRKLEAKGLDLIAVNDATDPDAGFEVETNRVTLIDAAGHVEEFPVLPKTELADRLLDRIERSLDR
ncbi:MAG: bifunctional phosphopantothenoylcysteine decarboxylase/phosphopantothenate--cysteine ligase CoaBC [Gemmatimonadota bacterium]|nr:bifunctional phosphopantothenoylcysteine decarboxylase/phosphopantothenate--cysteine ligase CoaBC [Gemmatimonadota bacterium]